MSESIFFIDFKGSLVVFLLKPLKCEPVNVWSEPRIPVLGWLEWNLIWASVLVADSLQVSTCRDAFLLGAVVECLFELLYPSCQLENVWSFSSDLMNKLPQAELSLTGCLMFFLTILYKLYRLRCVKILSLWNTQYSVHCFILDEHYPKLMTFIGMIFFCIVLLQHDWLFG